MTPTLEIVLIIGICVAVMIMIFMFIKISKTLDALQDNFAELTTSFTKAVEDIGEIKDQAITSMQLIDKSAIEFIEVSNDVQEKIDRIAGTFDPLRNMVDALQARIAPPVMQMAGVASAVSKAVNAFVDRLSR